MQVRTLDAEKFRGTKFFTLTPHKWTGLVKVRDPEALRLYTEQLKRERQQKAIGQATEPSPTQAPEETTTPASGNGKAKAADLSKAAVGASKRLLVSPALDALNGYLTEVKTAICGPFGPAQISRVLEGVYVIKDSEVDRVNAQLEQATQRLTDSWIDDAGNVQPGYIPAFIADIPEAQRRAKEWPLLKGGLGPLYSEADYANLAERLQGRFSLETLFISLSSPEDLPPALREKELAKFNGKLANAFEEITGALYASLGTFLDNLVERLTPTPDGKPKVFRDTLVENIRNFCASFDAKNFVKDDRLEGLVNQCRTLLQSADVDPEKLRKYSSVRENTAKAFGAIQAQLNAAIETRKARQFDLSEETE